MLGDPSGWKKATSRNRFHLRLQMWITCVSSILVNILVIIYLKRLISEKMSSKYEYFIVKKQKVTIYKQTVPVKSNNLKANCYLKHLLNIYQTITKKKFCKCRCVLLIDTKIDVPQICFIPKNLYMNHLVYTWFVSFSSSE